MTITKVSIEQTLSNFVHIFSGVLGTECTSLLEPRSNNYMLARSQIWKIGDFTDQFLFLKNDHPIWRKR